MLSRLENRWVPWFRAMEALGEDTTIRWGQVAPDGTLVDSGNTPHETRDGIGLFLELLRDREGFQGKVPKLTQEAPPPRRRLDVASRVLRAPDRAPLGWRKLSLRTSRTPPDAFAYAILSREETRELVQRRGAILSCRVLGALHRSVVPDLVAPCPRDAWLLPVNMRGAVKVRDPYQNQISFLPISVAPDGKDLDIQQTFRTMLRADLHWGTWDAMGARALLGPRFFRTYTRTLYRGLERRGGSGWLGSFSFGGVTATSKAQFSWYGVPPTTLMWPISAGAFVWGDRMSFALQVHASLLRDRAWAEGAVRAWKEAALR